MISTFWFEQITPIQLSFVLNKLYDFNWKMENLVELIRKEGKVDREKIHGMTSNHILFVINLASVCNRRKMHTNQFTGLFQGNN